VRVRRWLLVVLAASLLVAAPVPQATSQEAQERRLIEAACSIPRLFLERTVHGYRPDRSPEIQILTREPDWAGNIGLPHAGPWNYVQQVPLFWYGPGLVPPVGEVDRRVTLADIAPTQAAFLDFDFRPPDGRPLREVLTGASSTSDRPALLIVLVWDSAGNNVLAEHPRAWPNLRSLIGDGVMYTRAELGSAPAATAQIHATIGTGAFTGEHGITSHHLRMGQRVAKPYELGSRYLLLPTLADLYDRALGNRPLVGLSGTTGLHVGMLGHGGLWGGGDQDLAVLRGAAGAETLGAEGIEWNLLGKLRQYYRFVPYANDLPPITRYFDETDRRDGTIDGRWFGATIAGEETLQGFYTPARVPYQDRLIREIIEREGFGDDDVPDLLFINHKLIDYIGHEDSMNSVQMEDSIEAEDAALARLIRMLDEEVGEGRWVLTLTADHGATPDPNVSGADVVSQTTLQQALVTRFDTDGDDVSTIDSVQPTGVFVNERELRQEGATIEDAAEFMMTLTKGDVGAEKWPVAPADRDEPAFLAAYPSRLLERLPCLPADTG
jgi:hypothetical protein